jgi:hypothetical protein
LLVSFVDSWQSWVATVLGAVVAATATFIAVRYFGGTRRLLVVPLAWALGVFVGIVATVWSLDILANWGSTEVFHIVMEVSWLQKAVVIVIAPGASALAAHLAPAQVVATRS